MKKAVRLLKIVLPFIYIYFFLFGIKLLEISLAYYCNTLSKLLLLFCNNPFVGLFVGILFTSLVQSSSATTSITVGLVASGVIGIRGAIPIVMGANIGTTITNTFISFVHIARKSEFQRAISGAIVHDIFNILNVIILFPLELKFHILEKLSHSLIGFFMRSKLETFKSPLKIIVEPFCKSFHSIFKGLNIIPLLLSIFIIFTSLYFLVRVIRKMTSGKIEILVDKYLFKNTLSSFLLGLLLTIFVQSSSVTTSIVIPIVGGGILSLEKMIPYVMGANIGTTITALLASLVTGKSIAFQIALTHTFFNIIGTIIFLTLKFILVFLAEKIGILLSEKRVFAFIYILVIFFIVPLFLIVINWR